MTHPYGPVLTDANLEERKVAALERQAAADERQAAALETLATCKRIKVLRRNLRRQHHMVEQQVKAELRGDPAMEKLTDLARENRINHEVRRRMQPWHDHIAVLEAKVSGEGITHIHAEWREYLETSYQERQRTFA